MLTPLHRASPANTLSPAARFAVSTRTGWLAALRATLSPVARCVRLLNFWRALSGCACFVSLATTKAGHLETLRPVAIHQFRAAQIPFSHQLR